jgi:hypothetical protein
MEKLFTADSAEFSRFLRASDNPIPSQADVKQAYHFTKVRWRLLALEYRNILNFFVQYARLSI